MPEAKLALYCALLLVTTIILTACGGTGQVLEYYVSVEGSDLSGDGSSAKPWRTIQYALDHANYSGGNEVHIELAKGIYNENIVTTHGVTISGVGSSLSVSTGTDPNVPIQNVSVIARQLPANLPAGETAKSVYADASGTVTLENLNVYGGGVAANDSDLTLRNVVVYGVTGFYGIEIEDGSFSILDSRVQTQPGFFSDYGISVVASAGFVTRTYVGDGFDHAINILAWTAEGNVNQYNLPLPLNIYLTELEVEGSPIYYADGVRVQGPANVVIRDSTIIRPAGSEPAGSSTAHNPPYAGIEIAGYQIDGTTVRRVSIFDSQISGFDVGIGVNIATMQLMVQGTAIQGLTHGVRTLFQTYSDAVDPVVDFGGGQLGSQGGNTFSTQPAYAYFHGSGSYDVTACYNNWLVGPAQIDAVRIYDKLDDSQRGRVQWACEGAYQIIAVPQSDTNCRKGNSASYFGVVDFLIAGEAYIPVARGEDGAWLLFTSPNVAGECWAFADNLDVFIENLPVQPGDIDPLVLPIRPYPPGPTATATRPVNDREPQSGSTTVVTQCSDGIDNDADGNTDLADADCRSSSDDSE